jgi:hypothetical protein
VKHLGSFRHADLPFEQMVEMAGQETRIRQQPLQVMFVLLEEGLPALHLTKPKSGWYRRVPDEQERSDIGPAVDQAWNCR